MKTFISTLLTALVTFSLSAFAGFNTGEQNFAYPDGFAVKKLRVNGYAVELGREIQDVFGNFSDEEANALLPLLAQALEKLPSHAELRAKSHLRLTVRIVKGPRFNAKRAEKRGDRQTPALTAITLTIPHQAIASDVALFFNENLALNAPATVESKTDNVADFMRNLVSPSEMNGCEAHLLSLIGGPY